jgi:hypothetical protein
VNWVSELSHFEVRALKELALVPTSLWLRSVCVCVCAYGHAHKLNYLGLFQPVGKAGPADER